MGRLTAKAAQERRELGAADSKAASDRALVRAAERRVWRDKQARQWAVAEAKAAAGETLAQRGASLDLARDSPEYAQRGRQARRAEAKAKTGTGETPVAQTREATVAEAKTGSGEMSSPVRPSL